MRAQHASQALLRLGMQQSLRKVAQPTPPPKAPPLLPPTLTSLPMDVPQVAVEARAMVVVVYAVMSLQRTSQVLLRL